MDEQDKIIPCSIHSGGSIGVHKHEMVVTVEQGEIVGFGDIDKSGYLDRLYVHKDHQREGIATAESKIILTRKKIL